MSRGHVVAALELALLMGPGALGVQQLLQAAVHFPSKRGDLTEQDADRADKCCERSDERNDLLRRQGLMALGPAR